MELNNKNWHFLINLALAIFLIQLIIRAVPRILSSLSRTPHRQFK